MNRMLILCPLKIELTQVLHTIEAFGHSFKSEKVGPLTVYQVHKLGWSLAVAGHGKTQFGIQAQFLVDHLQNISGLICTGAAGSLSSRLSIGDVVIASATLEHDYKERFTKAAEPQFLGHSSWVRLSQKSFDTFKIHTGIVASGDEDIVDELRAKELHAHTGAIAVAWEGAGGARVATFNKLPYLEVRGITDQANKEAVLNFKSNLNIAMKNITEFLLKSFSSEEVF